MLRHKTKNYLILSPSCNQRHRNKKKYHSSHWNIYQEDDSRLYEEERIKESGKGSGDHQELLLLLCFSTFPLLSRSFTNIQTRSFVRTQGKKYTFFFLTF